MNDRDPDCELIAEIEQRIEQGTEFEGLTPVRAMKPKNPRAVFSVRLSPEEFTLIHKAAEGRSATVSDFIRDVAILAAEYELAAANDEQVDLVEVAKSLDVLRDRVAAALKSGARPRPAS